MKHQYSVAFARDNLARILHQAEEGTPVKITRRGKTVAVLLGVREYEKLQSSNFISAYQKWRANLDEEFDEPVFEGLRDRSDGREFRF